MINPPIRQIVTQKGQSPCAILENDTEGTVPFGPLKKNEPAYFVFRSACIIFAAQISLI